MTFRLLIFAGSISILPACVSHEYGLINSAENRPFGYSERASGESQIIVRTIAPNKMLAKSYWAQRVNELCPSGDAETNVYKAHFAAAPNMFGPVEMGAVMEGTVSCDGISDRSEAFAPVENLNQSVSDGKSLE
jgi:hypothetical protein